MKKSKSHLHGSSRRAWMMVLVGLLALSVPYTAQAQNAPSIPQAQQSAGSPYPIRFLDRPTTLPRGDSRIDAFVFATSVPGNPTSSTTVLGGGVGITDRLEIGGQAVPFEIEPGVVFTNPSVYATYQFAISKTTTIAPMIQAVYPLTAADPFFVDAGGTLYVNVGTWGYVALSPMLSLNARGDESGSSLSFPLTIMRQTSKELSFQVTTGVGLSRFDPRFGVSRRRDALDFNDVTVPATALVTYTVAHGSSGSALADLTLQFQWPQLYTRAPGVRGQHTDDWTVQIESSWYFIR